MPFIDENGNFVIEGPAKIITSITRIEEVENTQPLVAGCYDFSNN